VGSDPIILQPERSGLKFPDQGTAFRCDPAYYNTWWQIKDFVRATTGLCSLRTLVWTSLGNSVPRINHIGASLFCYFSSLFVSTSSFEKHESIVIFGVAFG